MSRKSKIGYEEKLESVLDYINGFKTITQISIDTGMSETQVRDWVRKYNTSGAKALCLPNKNKFYSLEVKYNAVNDYISGEASMDDLCSKYNISNHSVLRRWVIQYNNHNEMKSHNSKEKIIMIKGRKTTQNERVEIIEFCIKNNNDYGLTSKKYQVSYQQVYSWVKKYNTLGLEGITDKRGKKKSESEMSEKEKLEAEIKLIKAQNERLKIENEFLKKLEEIERRR